MSAAAELLTSLRARGVRFSPNGTAINYVPRDALTDAECEALKAHHAEIFRMLLAEADEHLTDLGNAARFARQHGDSVRYCYVWGTWLIWDRTRWRLDPGDGVMRLAKETARSIYAEATHEPNEEQRKKIAAWAVKSESEPALRRMLLLAQSEPGIPVTPAELDRDLFLVNCPNGTVELRTGELRSHRREDLITKITAAPYDPAARHPVLDSFLKRILPDPDVRAFVQRFAGYSLTGSIAEEKIFFGHGPTAGGKSTLLKALRKTLGDYAAVADFTTFVRRDAHDGPREDIARLAGVRLVVSVEVQDGTRLAEGLIKWLSGGDDIAARRLYERTFEFSPQFKLLLAANHRPRARDDDDALWRRILEVPFPESIPEDERDPAVKATLCDPSQAGPAILAWAVEGVAAWFRSGLGVPQAVRKATDSYRQAMDPLDGFLAECCLIAPSALATAKELRGAYEAWARENGHRHPLNGKAFAERLRARGCEPWRRQHGQRWWRGIGLLTEPGVTDEGDAVTAGDASPGSRLYARAHEGSSGSDVTKRHPSPEASPGNPFHEEPDWVRQ